MENDFKGDKKQLNHLTRPFERKIIDGCLPWVPLWMSTVHLTLMSIVWAVFVIFFGYLSNKNINWLWGFNLCIILQYITDMLDGEVGRIRNSGLIKWGFYMDHFCDYVFLYAVVIGYSFLIPLSSFFYLLLCLFVCAGFMVHVSLDFAITGSFKISFNRFGISEIRYLLIMANVIFIFLGKNLLIKAFPAIVSLSFAALLFVIYKSQKNYRLMDKNTPENPA